MNLGILVGYLMGHPDAYVMYHTCWVQYISICTFMCIKVRTRTITMKSDINMYVYLLECIFDRTLGHLGFAQPRI